MEKSEEEYLKELEESGVDVTDVTTEEPIPEESQPVEPEVPKEEEPKETETIEPEPKEQHKRSIYEEYKEKKAELKSERDLREQAERERDELRTKYESLQNADTPKEKQEATDKLEQFAKKIDADPQALKEMRELFLADAPKTDPAIAEKLEKFEAWQRENAKVIEKSRFEEEFTSVLPTLKETLPNASDEELTKIKARIDELSHTKEYHDKELDYVIFKNKTELSKLVSPKKRGMESKDKKDVMEESFDFDPNADYSKMTIKEREQWEEGYKKFTSGEGIVKDGKGRSLLI
jgi:hypothetical protein